MLHSNRLLKWPISGLLLLLVLLPHLAIFQLNKNKYRDINAIRSKAQPPLEIDPHFLLGNQLTFTSKTLFMGDTKKYSNHPPNHVGSIAQVHRIYIRISGFRSTRPLSSQHLIPGH